MRDKLSSLCHGGLHHFLCLHPDTGEAFKGGSAKDYHLTLGSNTFIPGFEDGIVGHEPGDKFDLELTFPKDYGVSDLAGAKTVFEVLLKQVNEVIKPAIDDEIAKKCGPFKTLDELESSIAEQRAKMARRKAEQGDEVEINKKKK